MTGAGVPVAEEHHQSRPGWHLGPWIWEVLFRSLIGAVMAWKLSRKRYGLCRTAASVLESGAAVCARQRSSAVRALGTEARGWGWGSPGTALHTPARPVVAGELGVYLV